MNKFEHIGTFERTKFRRFKTEKSGCYLCWENFPTVDIFEAHLALHLHSVTIMNCNASWKQLGRSEVASLACDIQLIATRLVFKLRNDGQSDVKVQFIGVFNEILQFGKLNPNEFPLTIKPGCTSILGSPLHGLGSYNHYVIVYEEASKKGYEKIQDYMLELNIDHIMMNCDENFIDVREGPKKPPRNNSATTDILEVKRINDVLKIWPLPLYEPCEDVKKLCYDSFLAPCAKSHISRPNNELFRMISRYCGLNTSNYFDMLSVYIQMEDFTARLAAKGNVRSDQELIRRENGDFSVTLSESEGRPLFLTKGDAVWVGHNGYPDVRIRGFVKKVSSDEILLKLRFNIRHETLPCYSIHFEANRLTFQMERKALDDASELNIIKYLFPSECRIENTELNLPQLQFFDPKIKSDVNQIAAVKHIVAGSSHPLPYLLVGFPGTGKTKVIVESICQLFSLPKSNRILVCASSNNVCDEIAQKVISSLQSTCKYQTPVTQQYNILRLYATSVRRSCKGDDLLDNSNFDDKLIPCLDEIYKYRIVVCTLTVAGRLAQGRIKKDHFTHLFVDECESVAESYTLVPIVGVCSSYDKIHAKVILCGDPLQLGPIVRSNVMKRYKLGESMFQRLYSSDPYQRDSKTREYRQRFISKLRNNYRSNPLLVAMPNKLYYKNEIRSSANSAHFKWYSELDFLPKRGFPILFVNVEGYPKRNDKCLSWYNEDELQTVQHYVLKLLQNRRIKESDIGIISPYKRQCINIEEMLETNSISNIEVGSVEQFQGKEKPIIIISTVRKEGIGFVREQERINVMITRAIGLLIIIGHRESLVKNSDWRKIVEYARESCV